MEKDDKLIELMAEMLIKQDQMSTDFNDVKNNLGELKNDVWDLKNDVSDLKNEMTKLRLQTSENTRAILKLAERMDSLESLG